MTLLRFWNELRQWSLIPDASIDFGVEPANEVFAGPATGASAQPAFRALVDADLPFPFSGGGRLLLPNAAYPGNNFYYKPSTGSDSNPGTAASPWATPAPLWSQFDFGGQAVTLNLQETTAQAFIAKPWAGGGTVALNLGGFAINAVSQNCITNKVTLPGDLTVQNGTLSNSGSGFFDCIQNTGVGSIIVGVGLTFGAALLFHMTCTGGGAYIKFGANYTISGNAIGHMAVFSESSIVYTNDPSSTTGVTVTTVGARAFSSSFASASGAASLLMNGMTYRDSGGGAPNVTTPANQRAVLSTFGIISGTGGNAAYFPGTGGITNNGGSYS